MSQVPVTPDTPTDTGHPTVIVALLVERSQDLVNWIERAVGGLGGLTDATDVTARGVSSAAAASEEMSQSIREIARQSQESADIAGVATQQVGHANQTMLGLQEQAKRIEGIVKLIRAIAGQTNLLALNATIEAARAGEVGRGFAVVAAEVKTLAKQTAQATEDIAALVAAIQAATTQSVLAMREVGSSVATITERAAAIAASVVEQETAGSEISQAINQASRGALAFKEATAAIYEGANADLSRAYAILDLARQLRDRI